MNILSKPYRQKQILDIVESRALKRFDKGDAVGAAKEIQKGHDWMRREFPEDYEFQNEPVEFYDHERMGL